MHTSTTAFDPRDLNLDPTTSRRATPFFLDGERDDAPARPPALRVVLGRDELPAESWATLTGFALRCGGRAASAIARSTSGTEPRSSTKSGLPGRRSVESPLLDGWFARFENRRSTVSVVARRRTLMVASVAPPPLGWRRSVAAGGVVCMVFDVRSRLTSPRRGQGPDSDARTVLEARLPVRLG